MELFPEILQAVPGDNFTVYAYCNDGAVRLVDVHPLIEQGGVFAQLADPDFFRERLTVIHDTVAWDIAGDRDPTACVDLDPFEIFETAPIVADPLQETG
jgi:hypothetical protein